jgi:hypothetical protein
MKLNNKQLIAGLVVVGLIVLVAAIVLWQTKEPSSTADPQPSSTPICKQIAGSQVCESDYVGLSEAEATAKATSASLTARVVARNGEGLAIDDDLRPERLNFTIENDRVSKVEFY